MMRVLQLIGFAVICFLTAGISYGQSKKISIDDQLLQDSIYKSNKKKVLNFSLKDFDALFFEYFKQKNDSNIVLSKTEFYNYTVRIAVFSDRWAILYPDQKEFAEKNKEKWMSESYQDYLDYKASQKK